MMRVPVLQTERLLIREFAVAALDAVHQLLDIELDTGATLDQRRQWLQWTVLSYSELANLRQPPYGDRAIVLKHSGGLIGACGFVPCLAPFNQIPGLNPDDNSTRPWSSPEVGLYWAVSPAYRRLGYATEAASALVTYGFENLRLRRIVATTAYSNTASVGVMRKLGMRVERNSAPEPEWLQIVGFLDNPSGRSASAPILPG
jgi:[ribosomal protein S5]-alanine N-acetyltransferase